jgi:hypothetical protein
LSDQLYRSPNLHKFVREQIVQQVCWFYNDVFTCLVVLHINICIDTVSFFFLFRQLKSDPDLYAGYVPMSYSEYLKKMSKYASICTYAVILFLMIRLLKSLCLLIALCMNVLGVVNGATMSLCRQLQIGYEGNT